MTSGKQYVKIAENIGKEAVKSKKDDSNVNINSKVMLSSPVLISNFHDDHVYKQQQDKQIIGCGEKLKGKNTEKRKRKAKERRCLQNLEKKRKKAVEESAAHHANGDQFNGAPCNNSYVVRDADFNIRENEHRQPRSVPSGVPHHAGNNYSNKL